MPLLDRGLAEGDHFVDVDAALFLPRRGHVGRFKREGEFDITSAVNLRGTLGAWNDKDKGWISACLLARVNGYADSVAISIRGPHKALDTGPEELTRYPVEEGAFYGEYFDPAGELLAFGVGELRLALARQRRHLLGREDVVPRRRLTEESATSLRT